MLTRRLDAALDAMSCCKRRLPDLADYYGPGSAQSEAIIDAVAAIDRVRATLFDRSAEQPRGPYAPDRRA